LGCGASGAYAPGPDEEEVFYKLIGWLEVYLVDLTFILLKWRNGRAPKSIPIYSYI
jgi:hypothetical protein